MTPEERQMLSGLFDRIGAAANGPKDQEADSFINEAMRATPAAGYVLAQTVLVQQQALEAAARRVSELEAKAAAPQEGGFLGNIGRSLFGGAATQTPPPAAQRGYDARAYEQRDPAGYPPQRPAYAPPPPPQQGGPWGGAPQPSAFAPQGGGFLQGALQTATGVAGGVLLGNALGGLFGGHSGGSGLFGGGGSGYGQGETVNETVNNYYSDDSGRESAQDSSSASGDDYAGGSDDFSGGGGDDFT